MKRNEFIKLGFYSALSILLSGCDFLATPQEPVLDIDSIPPIPITPTPVNNQYPLQIITKQDPAYELLRISYNKRIQKYPHEIIICHSTEDVSQAMRYAKQQQRQVTLKSGGHCFEGYCMDDNCILLYLSNMNQITWIDEDHIQVGPGTRLIDVYNALGEKGKILPAGSCGSVGVAGLTLGGGYGFFSRKYGLTCDSLEEVTMVDGQGTIHHSQQEPELLWACKGGNNGHLGAVTELKFKVHKAPARFRIWQFQSADTSPQFVSAFFQKYISMVQGMNNEAFASFFIRKNFIAIRIFEFGKTNMPFITVHLKDLPLKKSKGSDEALKKALNRLRGSAKPLYFKNASCGYFNEWSDIEQSLLASLDALTAHANVLFQVNSLGGEIQNVAKEHESAYPHRRFQFLSELQTYWNTEAEMEAKVAIFQQVQTNFTKGAVLPQYVNYPCDEFEHFNEAYYGASLARLRTLKKTYDPDNRIFAKQALLNEEEKKIVADSNQVS
jgi:FAD/FMN-containing dehydrogenase